MFGKVIDYLMSKACVNIRYLMHRDILKTPINDSLMQNMKTELLQHKVVKKCFSVQHSDGWFGHELHGIDGMDSLIGTLLRLGVDTDNPCIQKAVHALLSPEISIQHKNWFPGGEALDSDGRGGNQSVIAGILAMVHVSERTPPLADEIQLSINHLFGALQYKSVDDFSISSSKKRYYKKNVKFPGCNHVNLLANTHSWQTEENLRTAKKAMTHSYMLMKGVEETITFRKPKEFGSGFVGPFNFRWNALNPIDKSGLQQIINHPYRFNFGFWLKAVTELPKWAIQTNQPYLVLAELLETETILDLMTNDALKGFRRLLGIEPHWKNEDSIKCDLAFAFLKACWPILS